MDFWNTIIGNRLANTLVKELPKLTETKKQYTATMNDDLVQQYITLEVSAGNKYIGHFSNNGQTTVIMEKK